MPKLSGNKGEWSEIYAFLRLLEVKKLYAADAELRIQKCRRCSLSRNNMYDCFCFWIARYRRIS